MMRAMLRDMRADLEALAERMLALGLAESEILDELLMEALDRVEVAAEALDALLPLDRIPLPRLGALLEQIDGPVLAWVLERALQAAIRRRRRGGRLSLADVRRAVAQREHGGAPPPLL